MKQGHAYLKKLSVPYEVRPDGVTVVNGNLRVTTLEPFKGLGAWEVEGSFDCSDAGLTSLQGAPQSVGRDFSCHRNQLVSLEGAPQSVGRDFSCYRNQLTSLQGAPQRVGGNFGCSFNQLTSLQGAPQSVGWDFSCIYNQLTSLQGAPQTVGGDFYCEINQLTSLQGAPQRVGGYFSCGNNQLTSLQGAPKCSCLYAEDNCIITAAGIPPGQRVVGVDVEHLRQLDLATAKLSPALGGGFGLTADLG